MNPLRFTDAGASELVRSNQKDRFYLKHVQSHLIEISRHLLPLRQWVGWQRELQLASELIYYGVTTAWGNQTLGEEYCNTVQVVPLVGKSNKAAPSFIRRTLAVVLQALTPYFIEKCLGLLQKRLRDRSSGSTHSQTENSAEQEHLVRIIGFVKDVVSICSLLHMATFYIRGVFYQLSKRVTGIHYLMVTYEGTAASSSLPQTQTYRILGWFILLQLGLRVSGLLWKAVGARAASSSGSKDKEEKDDILGTGGMELQQHGNETAVELQREDETVTHHRKRTFSYVSTCKCCLCLEACQVETATPCGHVFCWECIADWLNDKGECPLCRKTVEPRQLIRLQHFQP